MEQMVERIQKAARTSDRKEIERIVHQLLTIGLCDHAAALMLLERR